MFAEMKQFTKLQSITKNSPESIEFFRKKASTYIDAGDVDAGVVSLVKAFNKVPHVASEMSCDGHLKSELWVDLICDDTGYAHLTGIWNKLIESMPANQRVFMSMSKVMLGSMHAPLDIIFEKVRFSLSCHVSNIGFVYANEENPTEEQLVTLRDEWVANVVKYIQLHIEEKPICQEG